MNNEINNKSKGLNWIILFMALFINIRTFQITNIDDLPIIIQWVISFAVVSISYNAIDFAYNFVLRKIRKNN